jgi:hypothetical protein
MNARPTPKTDALRDLYENYEHRANVGDIWELCEFFERERNELKRWTSVNGVIDLQRERDEAQEQLAAVTAQRDMLAVALQEIAEGSSCCACRGAPELASIAGEALQSLTPNAEL